MQNSFIPASDANFDTWEQNFVTVLPSLATALGLTAAEVTAILTNIAAHRSAYNTAVAKQAESRAAVANARQSRKAVEAAIRLLVKRINASPGCTNAMRLMLKIQGSEHTVDLNALKPSISVTVNSGAVSIKFSKPVPVDAVKVYCKRGTETDFTMLTINTHSPVSDSRPRLDPATPETRMYRLRFLVKDVEVGSNSDIVEVIV